MWLFVLYYIRIIALDDDDSYVFWFFALRHIWPDSELARNTKYPFDI
jgi:hypothetical protein